MARDPSRLPPRIVAEVAAEFYTHRKSRSVSARYLADIRARLGRFAEAFAVQVASVTTADVQGWLDGKQESPQTVKNFRTLLGTLFTFAERRGYIVKGGNPITDTEAPKPAGGKVEIYTPSEVARLLAIGAFAGLRTAEIQRITWADVDLAGGFITIGKAEAKTRSRRTVPVLPCLALWLAPYARKKGKVWPLALQRHSTTPSKPPRSPVASRGKPTACDTLSLPTGSPPSRAPRKSAWKWATRLRWYSSTIASLSARMPPPLGLARCRSRPQTFSP
jgi:integrase